MYMHIPGRSNPSNAGIMSPENPSIPAPVLCTLGVHKAPSHTSQQRLDGWLNALERCCNQLSQSHLGKGLLWTSTMVAPKLHGVLTDHASDQKKFFQLLVEWKKNIDCNFCAAQKLKTMTVDQQLYALTNYLDNTSNGVESWRTLPSDQQAAIFHNAWLALVAETGEAEFQKLGVDEQLDIDFLAWAGCCMHKELNAVKGGALRMAVAWEELGWNPPIALLNKYEVSGKT
ncbi:hypothetical protein RSOL_063630 [Rhizoctonia solani AG-3 Rhs1AP]|uniref:Uncharacterized protein n=1 Tax=Rhizoctonia solani AG-3 Rhs1AP TaxID=1086054 RepID=X8IX07_9AGAM|nr:hypothetical protein RSOL_063630 [Rhizoctonia solani AG-3 Rhs1AP]